MIRNWLTSFAVFAGLMSMLAFVYTPALATLVAIRTDLNPASEVDLIGSGGILETLYGAGNFQRVDDDDDVRFLYRASFGLLSRPVARFTSSGEMGLFTASESLGLGAPTLVGTVPELVVSNNPFFNNPLSSLFTDLRFPDTVFRIDLRVIDVPNAGPFFIRTSVDTRFC